MTRALITVAFLASATIGALVTSQKTESAGFLCAIRNPPSPLTYSIGRLSGKIETRCRRRIVGSLTATACIQRFAGLDALAKPESNQCNTVRLFYTDVAVAVVTHQCDHTTLIYFWRVQGWASVSDASLKVPYRSPVVSSQPVMEICF